MNENINNQGQGENATGGGSSMGNSIGSPMPSDGAHQTNQRGNAPQQFGAPPSPSLNIRTAETDVASIGRGDANPTPESVIPKANSNEPIFRPETQIGDPGMGGGEEETQGDSSKKKILTWIGIIIGIIIVGLVGYFFIYPILFPHIEPPVVTPPASDTPPTTTGEHQSLFLASADSMSEIRLPDLLHSTIMTNLANVASFGYAVGALQEIAVRDGDGNQVSVGPYLNAFVPALSVTDLDVWFENNFTAFMYYDENGSWPGLVAKIKSGVNIDEVRIALSAIEGGDISAFYLVNPGTLDVFKDGNADGHPTRYIKGSLPGASFNYGLEENYLFIGTSFNGLKGAIGLVGI